MKHSNFDCFSSIWLPKFSSFISAHYPLYLLNRRKENKCGENLKSVFCFFPETLGQKLVKDVNINDFSKIRGYLKISFIWILPFPISKGNAILSKMVPVDERISILR